jgi:hypothetical protein
MAPTNLDKWKFSLIGAILLLIVMNPFTYKLVQNLLGGIIGKIADSASGCPTTLGLFVHTLVYLVLVRYSMELKV